MLVELQDTPFSHRNIGEAGFEVGTHWAAARTTVTLDQIMIPEEKSGGRDLWLR
jgi:hypothetical protein